MIVESFYCLQVYVPLILAYYIKRLARQIKKRPAERKISSSKAQGLIQINGKVTFPFQIRVFKFSKEMLHHSFSCVSNNRVIRFEAAPHK